MLVLGLIQRHGRLKRRPYENHIVILYFSVFLSAEIELMPHAYIGALTNLWSVKLKAYSTNVFVTHRRSTNQFNICKPDIETHAFITATQTAILLHLNLV